MDDCLIKMELDTGASCLLCVRPFSRGSAYRCTTTIVPKESIPVVGFCQFEAVSEECRGSDGRFKPEHE